jgi:hypothetical protein
MLIKSICVLMSLSMIAVAVARMILVEPPQAKFSNDTLIWFLAAMVVLLLPRLKSLSIGGHKAEFAEMEAKLSQSRELVAAANDMNRDVGSLPSIADQPAEGLLTPDTMLAKVGIEKNRDEKNEDPWKGKFGNMARNNGRLLSARVEPIIGEDDWFLIKLTVEPTLSGAPLDHRKPVYFYLHPTFPKSELVTLPALGRAEIRLRAWGAFTVGVIADDGATRLELDLSANDEFPALFRSR